MGLSLGLDDSSILFLWTMPCMVDRWNWPEYANKQSKQIFKVETTKTNFQTRLKSLFPYTSKQNKRNFLIDPFYKLCDIILFQVYCKGEILLGSNCITERKQCLGLNERFYWKENNMRTLYHQFFLL